MDQFNHLTIELFEIELFEHLIVCKKWLMFNWIVSDP